MVNVSTMTMTMTMTFSSFVFRLSSFQVPSFKFQTRGAIGFFTLHSSLFTFFIAKIILCGDANTSYDTLTCTYDTLMIQLRAVTCN